MVVLHLQPINLGRENLSAIQFDLAVDNTLILGRNTFTGLGENAQHVQYISRKHAELIIESGVLFIRPTSRQPGWVYKNGITCAHEQSTMLEIGDTITLLGRLQFYSFMVTAGPIPAADANDDNPLKRKRLNETDLPTPRQSFHNSMDLLTPPSQTLSQAEQTTGVGTATAPGTIVLLNQVSSTSSSTPVATWPLSTVHVEDLRESVAAPAPVVAPAPAPAPAPPPTPTIDKSLAEDSECPICFDSIAFAHSISPCGDTFCYECILDWSKKDSKCPFCSSAFDATCLQHNRVLDNMIRRLMEVAGAEQLSDWEERAGRGKERKRLFATTGNKGSSSVSSISSSSSSSSSSAPICVPGQTLAAAPAIPAYFAAANGPAGIFAHRGLAAPVVVAAGPTAARAIGQASARPVVAAVTRGGGRTGVAAVVDLT